MIRLMGLVTLKPSTPIVKEALLEDEPTNTANAEENPTLDTADPLSDEGEMARVQLLSITKQAGELYNMTADGDHMEAWAQEKLTIAADYINSIYNFIQYEKNSDNTTIGNGEGSPAEVDQV